MESLWTRDLVHTEDQNFSGPCRCRSVGDQMVKLLVFLEINASGIRKIVKKFDKKVHRGMYEKLIVNHLRNEDDQLAQLASHEGTEPTVIMNARKESQALD